jgi:ribosomal protein S18 acetylase RimI-like enzyme
MGKIIFKKIERSDLPEFYSAGQKIFSSNTSVEKWNPENIADIFMDDSSLMIIALRNKKISGIAVGKISDMENQFMEIIWFGVDEKFSETGLAEDLLGAFIDAARKYGISSVRIKADSNISKVFPLDFNKIGFVETGTIRVLDLKL